MVIARRFVLTNAARSDSVCGWLKYGIFRYIKGRRRMGITGGLYSFRSAGRMRSPCSVQFNCKIWGHDQDESDILNKLSNSFMFHPTSLISKYSNLFYVYL